MGHSTKPPGFTDKLAPYFGCLGWMLLVGIVLVCIGSFF